VPQAAVQLDNALATCSISEVKMKLMTNRRKEVHMNETSTVVRFGREPSAFVVVPSRRRELRRAV
jgi:hypothetical protein